MVFASSRCFRGCLHFYLWWVALGFLFLRSGVELARAKRRHYESSNRSSSNSLIAAKSQPDPSGVKLLQGGAAWGERGSDEFVGLDFGAASAVSRRQTAASSCGAG